jgi:hypothetical protein
LYLELTKSQTDIPAAVIELRVHREGKLVTDFTWPFLNATDSIEARALTHAEALAILDEGIRLEPVADEESEPGKGASQDNSVVEELIQNITYGFTELDELDRIQVSEMDTETWYVPFPARVDRSKSQENALYIVILFKHIWNHRDPPNNWEEKGDITAQQMVRLHDDHRELPKPRFYHTGYKHAYDNSKLWPRKNEEGIEVEVLSPGVLRMDQHPAHSEPQSQPEDTDRGVRLEEDPLPAPPANEEPDTPKKRESVWADDPRPMTV